MFEMPTYSVGNVLLLLLLLCVHSSLSFRRVCYFTNWSRDLQQAGARFQLTDVEPFLCTHLIYAFASVHPANSSLSPIVTLLHKGRQGELDRYTAFNDLKKVNTQLKTLLSVGGSYQANGDFVQVVSSDEKRKSFAANVVNYLRTWGFDGLDIDWEYPGSPPETKRNFVNLLRELRAAVQRDASDRRAPALLLSVAAPVSRAQMQAGYDIPQVSSLVDNINLMAYDFHGFWNRITSFNSPLYARKGDLRFSTELSVNWSVQSWLRQGAPAEKLVLGIAGYGQSFTLTDPSKHGVGVATNGSGAAGRWRRMDGQLAYYEICEYITAGGTQMWDELQQVPYVYLGDQWVGFDNEQSVTAKVKFALQQRLGGAMIWSLDMDDFRGAFCGKGRYPLLTSIVRAADAPMHLTDSVTWAHPDASFNTGLPTALPVTSTEGVTTMSTIPLNTTSTDGKSPPTTESATRWVPITTDNSHASLGRALWRPLLTLSWLLSLNLLYSV